MLKYLFQKNLYLKPKKSKFYKKEVNFPYFMVKQNRNWINLDEIQAIKNSKTLINIWKL